MVILCDTREQQTGEALMRYKQFGCPFERQKIDTGDYSAKFLLPDGSWFNLSDRVTVERKMSLDELCMCFGKERDRFVREFDRAKEGLTRMWILVEGASFEKVFAGNYRSKFKPQSLMASIIAWQARYNIRIIMCDKTATGRLVHDILYYEGREAMMGMVDS